MATSSLDTNRLHKLNWAGGLISGREEGILMVKGACYLILPQAFASARAAARLAGGRGSVLATQAMPTMKAV